MSNTALESAVAVVLPEMQRAERALREAAQRKGIAYTVANFGGLRTEADTARILGYRATDYAAYVRDLKARKPNATPIPIETWRPIAQFGNSYHNYGAALDLTVTTRPAGMSAAAALETLGTLAPACGLRWGGTFSAARNDPPHFELAIPLAEARRLWNARNASKPITAPGAKPGNAAVPVLLWLVAGFALLVLARRA